MCYNNLVKLIRYCDISKVVHQEKVNMENIQIEAYKVLKETNIEKILTKFGDVRFEGSYLYRTMVARDVDISIFGNSDFNERAKLIEELAKIPLIQKIQMHDLVNFGIEKEFRPNGIWFGLTVLFNGNEWNFDIWLVDIHEKKPLMVNGSQQLHKRMLNLTDYERAQIVAMKQDFLRHDKYIKGASSGDIYSKVLRG